MNRIRPYLEEAGLTETGAVPFASCLPLLECRAKSRLPENARSVIVCAFPYYTGEWEGRNLSRYAIVPDYHREQNLSPLRTIPPSGRRTPLCGPGWAFWGKIPC